MLQVNGNVYEGTVKDFIDAKISVNGVKLDANAISNLYKFGFCKQVGTAEKQEKRRGKAAGIFRIESKDFLQVTC